MVCITKYLLNPLHKLTLSFPPFTLTPCFYSRNFSAPTTRLNHCQATRLQAHQPNNQYARLLWLANSPYIHIYMWLCVIKMAYWPSCQERNTFNTTFNPSPSAFSAQVSPSSVATTMFYLNPIVCCLLKYYYLTFVVIVADAVALCKLLQLKYVGDKKCSRPIMQQQK